jgi:SAM-dependent methyltransferase
VSERGSLGAGPAPGPCPACGAALRPWRRATASDAELAGRNHYSLYRCETCGTALTALDEDTEPALYEQGTYAPARRSVDPWIEPLRRISERDRMRCLRGLPPGSTVVEVGAGDGRFVARMRRAGLDARGFEPSATFAARARADGAPVERGSVETIDVARGSADAVVAWHVLEHLGDPSASVARMAAWLRPEGRLVLACPNLDGWAAALGGDRWFNQDVPRHRTHFTARGLRSLVERAGLEVVTVRHWVVEQNPLGMWMTLLNRLTAERDVAFRLLKGDIRFPGRVARVRDVTVTILAGALLAPVAVLLELLATAARRGGSVVVVARRAER